MLDKPFANRLIHEKSPHLLSHAHNPVDWYPWGDEAFEKAKKEEKPIFLSIGYSACHLCHKMDRECFSNEDIANMMNEAFVCVKVDREELPEVDALYMELAQSITSGVVGWPLNVVLNLDLKPFFAMTYVSLDGFSGALSISQMVQHVKELWKEEERESVNSQAEKVMEIFENTLHEKGLEMPDDLHISNTAELLFRLADPVYGGIKGMPKFPIVPQVCFMLRYAYDTLDSRALFYVEKTMEMMNRGGIHDHLGGGYFRYTIDEQWRIPHFEKMCCDNALLIRAFLEMWQLTKKTACRQLGEEILRYVLENMEHPEGGFYCSEDSDAGGIEGAYYTWFFEEVLDVLGLENGLLFCEYYSVSKEGDFHGKNILHTPLSLSEFAEKKEMSKGELEQLFEVQRDLLLKERRKRIRPFKDKKILSSWNGIMIHSLAEAARILQDGKYLESAKKTVHFVKANLWKEGSLYHRWCDGEARFLGNFEDYAFMIQGLLALFELEGDAGYLAWAMQMTAILENAFKAEDGAFYNTDGSDHTIIARRCEFTDGAQPSANAVHCENLMRIYRITEDKRYLKQVEDILRAVKEYLDGFNPSYCYHLAALQWYFDSKAVKIVIALNEREDYKFEMQNLLSEVFIPYKVVVWRREDDEHLFELLPFIRRQKVLDQKTTVYVSLEKFSYFPSMELSDISRLIKGLSKISVK